MSDENKQAGTRYFTTSIMMLLVIGLVAVAITQGWVDVEEKEVIFTADLPERLTLDPNGGEVPLSYTTNLKNNTDETVNFEVDTPCHIHRWFVADENGNFVQGEPPEECAKLSMNATLQPGEQVRDVNEIMIDSSRYQPGNDYQLVIRYWGQEMIHVLRIE